jgi:hypothetical protein
MKKPKPIFWAMPVACSQTSNWAILGADFVGSLAVATLTLIPWIGARAGSATLDFDSPPANVFFWGNNPAGWRGTDGNPASGGYLSLTDGLDQLTYGALAFDELDRGQDVRGFTLSMDVRIGNGTRNRPPADGISISFARADDPVFGNLGTTAGFARQGEGPEYGTGTGLAICLNTYNSSLQVYQDGMMLASHDMPVINGSVTNPNSIQTGPWDATGSAKILGWARLEITFDEASQLTVKYKGAQLVRVAVRNYRAGPHRFVIAARTGAWSENHHLDNIQISTRP